MTAIAAIQGMGTNHVFQGEPTNKTRINRIVNMEKHIQIKPLTPKNMNKRENDSTLTDLSHLKDHKCYSMFDLNSRPD